MVGRSPTKADLITHEANRVALRNRSSALPTTSASEPGGHRYMDTYYQTEAIATPAFDSKRQSPSMHYIAQSIKTEL